MEKEVTDVFGLVDMRANEWNARGLKSEKEVTDVFGLVDMRANEWNAMTPIARTKQPRNTSIDVFIIRIYARANKQFLIPFLLRA